MPDVSIVARGPSSLKMRFRPGLVGPPLAEDDFATQAQAEAGTDVEKVMSPLRTKQGILANAKSSTWLQSGTGAVARTLDAKLKDVVNIIDFGGVGDGVFDNTAALSAMITFLNSRSNGSSGGGIGIIPQGRWRVAGDLPYIGTNVGLFGDGPQATLVDFQNGSNDCFKIGDPTIAVNTRGQVIAGMYLGAQAKTGGTMIKVRAAFNTKFSRIQSEANWIGIDIGPRCNSTTLEDCFISATQGATPVCLKFVAGASNADRSDVLAIRNIVLTGQWSDATCFEWDGAAYTVTAQSLRMLHAKYGMVVKNSAGDSSWYPSFLNAHDIEAEGFKQRAVWIQAGAGFKITGSDINNLTAGDLSQGAADLSSIQIDADIGASYTRAIQISDTRIGGTQREGLVFDARNMMLSNIIFYTTSYAGVNSYPAMRFSANAQNVQLSNIQAEEFGGAARSSYLLQLDAGAARISGNNLNAQFCNTGAILDNSGNTSNVFSNIVRTGSLIPSQSHNGVWWNRAPLPNAYLQTRSHNEDAAGTSQAGFTMSTGLANTFRQFFIHNNAGTPYSMLNGGSAVTTQYWDTDLDVWRNNAGTDKARLTLAAFNLVSAAAVYQINAVKVVGARDTGWTAMTGTGSKAALATAAAGTVSAAYVQAEAQASRDRIAALEARLRSLDAALFTHGLIGA
ncbi:hypothetical protein J2Y55_005832 [Bosea sp. BE125]|uniref:glycosyl hydrolase family 28-related protein n=1 Tax=Bosea sp. BE125 TaxID=2817909 RepID=UPI00285A940E|nr:glycosyl hydrolase family 28-related protein [Bosea sp. BE125]MDR6874794.1 hypothetical protein [Bosea sp. BE125]